MSLIRPKEEFGKWGEFLANYFKNPLSFWLTIGLLVLGVCLLFIGNQPSLPKNERVQDATKPKVIPRDNQILNQERELEAELTATLEQIAGVGRVRVDLRFKSSGQKIWERKSRLNKRISEENNTVNREEDINEELVLARGREGNDTPILKEALSPEIQGIVIIATGASNYRIKELLTITAGTMLGLPAHKIIVVPGVLKEEGLQ